MCASSLSTTCELDQKQALKRSRRVRDLPATSDGSQVSRAQMNSNNNNSVCSALNRVARSATLQGTDALQSKRRWIDPEIQRSSERRGKLFSDGCSFHGAVASLGLFQEVWLAKANLKELNQSAGREELRSNKCTCCVS